MGPAIEASGGSAGNTTAGVASLGGRAAFIGKVADDAFGAIYRHDMQATGVHFGTRAAHRRRADGALDDPDHAGRRADDEHLSRRLPGARRPTTSTPTVVGRAAITYLEGYLWDPPEAKDAFVRAAEIAHAAGRKVSLIAVGRLLRRPLPRRNSSISSAPGRSTSCFANDSELRSLYETADVDTAVAALQADCALAAVTIGADGALVVTPEATIKVPATPVETVVDLTGAGDLFASGFLFGVARGMALADAGRLGTLAAVGGDRPYRAAAGDLAQGRGAGGGLRDLKRQPRRPLSWWRGRRQPRPPAPGFDHALAVERDEIDRVEQQRRETAIAAGIGDDLAGEGEEQARALDQHDRVDRLLGDVDQAEDAGIDQLDGEKRGFAVDGARLEAQLDLDVAVAHRPRLNAHRNADIGRRALRPERCRRARDSQRTGP